MTKTAVYPGTFDPVTLGHLDLIARSARIFDKVVVAVATTSVKRGAMFDYASRAGMIGEVCMAHGLANVSVAPLDCLLVDFCRRMPELPVVVRGLRVYSDFEYEFQMALTNRKLAPEIETLFMMPQEEHSYVTASLVRELARYGQDASQFVPAEVVPYIGKWIAANGGEAANG